CAPASASTQLDAGAEDHALANAAVSAWMVIRRIICGRWCCHHRPARSCVHGDASGTAASRLASSIADCGRALGSFAKRDMTLHEPSTPDRPRVGVPLPSSRGAGVTWLAEECNPNATVPSDDSPVATRPTA